ncbi:tyrosine-type recombinase/integrase [Sphingomonas glacialis]|uniref:Site-specific integrase n=1 Tax=Sphingomonas glacialis TaxID=658225 RepID=A0A502G3R7_9SPHN|nr:site-specific integrase [Sphingomonas glacialis]TPG56374.1 site-specific integrase [Sphingomonas glacialis]
MGRTVKDVRLQDRAARARLPVSPDIYWRPIAEGCHIGYYRGARGGKWVARYRLPGSAKGYVKERIGEADDVRDADGEKVLDWSQAQKAAHDWFEDKARGGVKPAGPFTVSDALDEYSKSFKARTGAVPTDMTSRVEIIRPVLGHLEVANLTQTIISDWFNARASSAKMVRTKKGAEPKLHAADTKEALRKRRSTANRLLTVLKAALNLAAETREWLPIAAWAKVKPFRGVDVPKRRFLTDDEARRLVNASEADFRPMVRASLLTGARYGELRHAKVKDYDRQSRTVYLVETKNAIARPAYLDDEGAQMLETAVAGKGPGDLLFGRPDGTQWKQADQLRRMNDAFDRAKIDKTTFHDLRRSYGARLARAGVPMAVIAEALGHKDERITRKHYAHLAPSYVSETVRAAVAGLGIVEKSNVVPLEKSA